LVTKDRLREVYFSSHPRAHRMSDLSRETDATEPAAGR
jgi:hypothetical protein